MKSKYKGSVLITSLVLLVMLSLTGILSLNSSLLEQKIIANLQNEELAFQVAEIAIKKMQYLLNSTSITLSNAHKMCQDGWCFSGEYPKDIALCNIEKKYLWKDETVWEDSNRYRESTITLNNAPFDIKSIVEFLCYIPKNIGFLPDPLHKDEWLRFYRITVLVLGPSNTSRVMLQKLSTLPVL